MANLFSVRFPGADLYSKAFQTEEGYARGWQAVLRRNYNNVVPVCCCPGTGQRNLAIRYRESTDRYSLARYPETGYEHAGDCKYFFPHAQSCGLKAYINGVVEENDSGEFLVRLSRGMQEQEVLNVAGPAEIRSPGNPRPQQRAMTLLGLLHLIWTTSQLINWYPRMEGKRTRYRVPYFILKAAREIKTNGIQLASVLLVCSPRKDAAEKNHNQQVVEEALAKHRRLIAVAPLAAYNPDAHANPVQLPIDGFHGMPWLKLEEGLWRHIGRRFSDEISAWKKGGRVIAVAHLSVAAPKTGERGPQGLVHDVGLMYVSERWIPLDSSYEAIIESRLYEQGRAFQKPVRFDADEFELFPDFWLLDVGKSYPMEVFGRADEEYLAHRNEKVRYYNGEFPEGWWYWDACQKGPLKDFPPATRNYR
ncbi:DUF1173 family protein [Pseudomonas peli]|uniref:DUF1173 family protein n=1 Tax=Pseudomonas peli TaxID=592361 RepID=UPI0024ACB08F|nr:DUF1173 family protein [Pseudomonas peli]